MAARSRKYTQKFKREAIELAGEIGPAEAARQLGIPSGTLTCWTFHDRKKSAQQDKQKAPKTAEERPEARDEEIEDDEHPQRPSADRETDQAKTGATGQRRQSGATRHTARRYTPSEKARILEFAAERGISAAAHEFGASRFAIYDWRRKVERAAAGEGPSPTSGPAPAEVEAQRDREILSEWHRHPGLGPSQIRNQLRRRGVKVAVATVRRVMEDAGYRPPKVRSQRHDERFEAVRPNHLWHLDYVHRHINRAQTHTLILLDDCSRYVTGHGVDDAERADLVIETFEEAVGRHGKPEMVLHDKGSAFWSWRGISRFTALLTEMGIDQIVAEHKEWNGKLEVFNANLAKELFDVHRFYDVSEMRRRLATHLHWYNHGRTSHALGGLLVPADRYYGRNEEVLARIEAGAGREGLETLDLRDRCLELFKVISQGGVPEVWLMGQKVLELKP
jgi:putative transposase